MAPRKAAAKKAPAEAAPAEAAPAEVDPFAVQPPTLTAEPAVLALAAVYIDHRTAVVVGPCETDTIVRVPVVPGSLARPIVVHVAAGDSYTIDRTQGLARATHHAEGKGARVLCDPPAPIAELRPAVPA